MTNLNPEQIARDNIDRQLILCGCVIQDKQRINLGAGTDVNDPDPKLCSRPVFIFYKPEILRELLKGVKTRGKGVLLKNPGRKGKYKV